MMKYGDKEKMKGKSGDKQPLPKGDKYHYYPKGSSLSKGGYPDSPAEVMKAQNANVKNISKDSYGMRN